MENRPWGRLQGVQVGGLGDPETRVVAKEVKEAGWVWVVFWRWNQELDLLADGVWVSGR